MRGWTPQRQFQREGAALARRAADAKVAAHQPGQAPPDREPEPRTAWGRDGFALGERFEDALLVRGY